MADGVYIAPVMLRGDMIASLSGQPTNVGNPGDPGFGIALPNVTALADSSELFRLVWYGNTSTQGTATEFLNGQYWRLERYDPAQDPSGDPASGDDGWAAVAGYAESVTPRQDLVNDLGAGDSYVVFSAPGGFLLFDMRGGLPASPTNLNYLASDENDDLATGENDGNLDFGDAYTALCFCAGTMIETSDGPRPVEALRPGDLVQTRDHGLQPLRWTGRHVLSEAALRAAPHLRPLRIAAGALSRGVPALDLEVSPQHRLLVRSRVSNRMTRVPEVLVAARHLAGLPGIGLSRAPGPVRYHHLLPDRHELVLANGALAESLFVGPEPCAPCRGRPATRSPCCFRN